MSEEKESFFEWAFAYDTPDWIAATVILTGAALFVGSILATIALFASGWPSVAVSLWVIIIYTIWYKIWAEYKKSQKEEEDA